MSLWVVRAGKDGEQETEALKNDVVSILWDLPDLSNFRDKDSLKEAYIAAYPDATKAQLAAGCAQIWSFVSEIQKGDRVVIPLKTRPEVVIGKVVGDYEYQELAPNVQHIRRVDSFIPISKSEVPSDVFETLNIRLTVRKIKSVSVQQWFLENVADKEHEDLILAYARVSKKIADGNLTVSHISLEREMESGAFLKKRLQEFLEKPTKEIFESFWTPPFLYAAVRSGSAAAMLEKAQTIDDIATILREMSIATSYDQGWETQLGAEATLQEFWGKIKDQPVRNSCTDAGLSFFGYTKPASYAAFLETYRGFKRYYRKVIGKDSATRYPIDVELDQLFNFIDKARDGDADSKIDDDDVQALYTIVGKKRSVNEGRGDAKRRYWIEITDVNHHRDRQEGPYKLGAALWSPQLSTTGQKYYAYENMQRVKPGDIVLHLPDREGFSGVSVAASAAVRDFVGLKGTRYEGQACYLVSLRDYVALDELFRRTSFLKGAVYEQLKALHAKYSQLFYHKEDGNLVQGAYLTEAPIELVQILNHAYKQEAHRSLPHFEDVTDLFDLYYDLIAAYGRAAQRIAEGELQYKPLDVGASFKTVEELRQLFNAFLDNPTESNLRSFWNTKYITMTVGKGSASQLLEANKDIRVIQQIFLELRDSDVYDAGWEDTLRSHLPLQELWCKLRGTLPRAYSWTGLFFFSRPFRSFSECQVQVGQFLDYYQKVLGAKQATQFPIGIEIEQLFYFIYLVRENQISSRDIDQLGDADVKRLYDLVQQVNMVMRGSDVPMVNNSEDREPPEPKNFIFYGPPGTGKTYKAINRALEIIYDNPKCTEGLNRQDVIKRFKQLRKDHRIEFVTFHQAYSYEEFVEGIRPVLDEKNIEYTLNEGVFKQIAQRARDGKSNGNYVLIIDEINRGNISKIFGELITLIEEDKREGEDSEITTTLPYSQKDFSVPSNLYIVGTMNTADRSIALMDVALRRRFMFEEFMPDIKAAGLNKFDIDGLNLGDLLTALNERIKILVDRDHQIGHSFFIDVMRVPDASDRKQALHRVWHYELVPLFQEYFYNDYEKLKQLLGKYKKNKDGVERGFIDEISEDEIKKIIGTTEGFVADIYVGSIHEYTDADALINALKQYVSRSAPTL